MFGVINDVLNEPAVFLSGLRMPIFPHVVYTIIVTNDVPSSVSSSCGSWNHGDFINAKQEQDSRVQGQNKLR
jgi:hypothetical protein